MIDRSIDFSQIANVTLQLVINSSEQFVTYAFENLFPNGNIAGHHDILKAPVTPELDMTMAFPAEMIRAALQHEYEPKFLDPSVFWDSSVRSADDSFSRARS